MYVQENANPKYRVRKGTITGVDDGDAILSFGAGKRCLLLYAGEKDAPESICFIRTDDKGFITEIMVTDNSRYHFAVDEPPVLKEPEDEEE